MLHHFKHMVFLIRLYAVLQRDSMIKDHRDVIALEKLAKDLDIPKDVVQTFTLTTPWELLNEMRDQVILNLQEAHGEMEGVDTVVPVEFEERIATLTPERFQEFCPDYVIDYPKLLRYLTVDSADELIQSPTLEGWLAVYAADLNCLESIMCKEYDKDLDLALRCTVQMMCHYAVFEYIHTCGLDMFTPADTNDDMWYKKFRDGIRAAEVLVETAPDLIDVSKLSEEQLNLIDHNLKELGVTGMEGFHGLIQSQRELMLLKLTGNEGFQEEMKRMGSRAAEMLMAAIKSLKARFDERKREGSKEAEGIQKEIDKAVESLKDKAGEVDANHIEQLKKQLAKAGFETEANKLSGVKTFTQLGQALSNISGDLTGRITEMKEAEAKMREAEAKAKEASTPPAGTSDGADDATKEQIKAQMGEASKEAKELMKSASEAIGVSLKGIAALRSVKSTLDRVVKSSEPKVDGQEAWML